MQNTRKIMIFGTLLVILGLLQGCGPAALPAPTHKSVRSSDLAGTWEYEADFGQTRITLNLSPDGTFTQSIYFKGRTSPQVHRGNWRLRGALLDMSLLKPDWDDPDAEWTVKPVDWWVMDSEYNKTKFSICGAADDYDPDNCYEMKKLPNNNATNPDPTAN